MTSLSRKVPATPPGMEPKVLTTFTYDNADGITAITHTYVPFSGPSSTLATYTYGYSAASELTTEANQDGSFTYTYDNTSQLTGVDASAGTCGATGCDESFSYDVNGNRTMTGYTTGTGNRLTSDGTYNYTFDDNGNLILKSQISNGQKWEYSWDYRNRLTQVVVKDSSNNILQQSDYTNDALDRRIIKSFDDDGPGSHTATVTKTLYDGISFTANPYADFSSSNTLTMRYLYGPAIDFILARRDASGTVAWHLADHLDSVHDIANNSGTVADHVSYSAYGKVTAETNPSNGDRFKYTGREYDSETALYDYRARVYDSWIGRFTSVDPLGYTAGDSNLNRYVSNSPLDQRDPTGLDGVSYYASLYCHYSWICQGAIATYNHVTSVSSSVIQGNYTAAMNQYIAFNISAQGSQANALIANMNPLVHLAMSLTHADPATTVATVIDPAASSHGAAAGPFLQLVASLAVGGYAALTSTKPVTLQPMPTTYHYTTFPRSSFAGGLWPNSFTTSTACYSGTEANACLQLGGKVPSLVYPVDPPAGTVFIGPEPVLGGSGIQFRWPYGTAPGSVGPPSVVPK